MPTRLCQLLLLWVAALPLLLPSGGAMKPADGLVLCLGCDRMADAVRGPGVQAAGHDCCDSVDHNRPPAADPAPQTGAGTDGCACIGLPSEWVPSRAPTGSSEPRGWGVTVTVAAVAIDYPPQEAAGALDWPRPQGPPRAMPSARATVLTL